MTIDDIESRLLGYWPHSKQITVEICAEIVSGLSRRNLGPGQFERALRGYREHDERWPPTWNKLRPFLPSGVEPRVIMGIPNWMHDETARANELWSKARHVEYCELGIACAAGVPGGYTLGHWYSMLEGAKKEEAERDLRRQEHKAMAVVSKLRLDVIYRRMLDRARGEAGGSDER